MLAPYKIAQGRRSERNVPAVPSSTLQASTNSFISGKTSSALLTRLAVRSRVEVETSQAALE